MSFNFIFYSNHQAKTTVERCNHTPDAPKVGLVGLDASQNQILLGIGCFSKITTEKYVERLVRSCVNMTAFWSEKNEHCVKKEGQLA